FGPKRVLYVALALLAIGLLVLATARGDVAVGVAGTFCGLGHGYAFPIMVGLVVHRARQEERGAALALYTALFDGGTLLGGPLFGAVVRGFGYPAMFRAAAALVAVGAAGLALFDRRPAASVTR